MKKNTIYVSDIYINMSASSSTVSQVNTTPAPVKMTLKERRLAREIKNYQEHAGLFLPAATFRRLVASITSETCHDGIRFNGQSIKALQCAAEDELTTCFQGANIVATVAGRDTVTPNDLLVFQTLRHM